MTFGLSPTFGRRSFLLGAGSAAFAAAMSTTALAGDRSFVASESGPLRRVLVHAAAPADHASCGLFAGGDPFWREAADMLVLQNANMIRKLEETGTQVLRLEAVLDSAIEVAREHGAWDGWLRERFPELAGRSRVTAAALLGRAGAYRHEAHRLDNLRDFAAMLPGGLVLSNSPDRGLAKSEEIIRFALRYSPELRAYPVLFDPSAHGLNAECGDILVLDRQRLLVGIGNHTEPRTAPALAKATGMEVIAVELRDAARSREAIEHLNAGVAQTAPGRIVMLASLAEGGEAVCYAGGSGASELSTQGQTPAACLQARRIAVLPVPDRRAACFLATNPGAGLAFAGAQSASCLSGMRTVAVGPGESWLGQVSPQRLVLPLERG